MALCATTLIGPRSRWSPRAAAPGRRSWGGRGSRRPSWGCGRPGVAGPGAAVADRGAVGVEVVRGGVGDHGLDDVARARGQVAGREVHQAAVAGPAAHPARTLVLATLTDRDQHLGRTPDLL